MGNHNARTHPRPYLQVLMVESSATEEEMIQVASDGDVGNNKWSAEEDQDELATRPMGILVIDSTVISSSANSISPYTCETISRRPRSPREAPDLYVYCSYRNWDLAKKQIELNRGLDYVSTNRRFSVLHVAVENNAPVELIRLILAKGVNPNFIETLFDQTPLHIIMKNLQGQAGNPLQTLELLLSNGADVNAKAKYGRTPLYCAIKHHVPERLVAYLLLYGALVTRDVMIFAREKSRREIVNLLDRTRTMSVLCSARLLRKKRRSPSTVSVGSLPIELVRELQKMLFN
jgi:hypothetical protein